MFRRACRRAEVRLIERPRQIGQRLCPGQRARRVTIRPPLAFQHPVGHLAKLLLRFGQGRDRFLLREVLLPKDFERLFQRAAQSFLFLRRQRAIAVDLLKLALQAGGLVRNRLFQRALGQQLPRLRIVSQQQRGEQGAERQHRGQLQPAQAQRQVRGYVDRLRAAHRVVKLALEQRGRRGDRPAG